MYYLKIIKNKKKKFMLKNKKIKKIKTMSKYNTHVLRMLEWLLQNKINMTQFNSLNLIKILQNQKQMIKFIIYFKCIIEHIKYK